MRALAFPFIVGQNFAQRVNHVSHILRRHGVKYRQADGERFPLVGKDSRYADVGTASAALVSGATSSSSSRRVSQRSLLSLE